MTAITNLYCAFRRLSTRFRSVPRFYTAPSRLVLRALACCRAVPVCSPRFLPGAPVYHVVKNRSERVK